MRAHLQGYGRIHIERPLPFLCLYRRPVGRADKGTSRLVIGQPAYLTVAGDRAVHSSVQRLLKKIVVIQGRGFGEFLIIELAARRDVDCEGDPRAFRVVRPIESGIAPTIEALESALAQVRLGGQLVHVEEEARSTVAPKGLRGFTFRLGPTAVVCHLLLIEVPAIYRSGKGAHVLPAVLREVRRNLTRVLRHSFFSFTRTQALHQPRHFHVLGRRVFEKAVRDVDQRLSTIEDAFDFLLLVTPTNIDVSWSRFRRHRFERAPEFFYRPLPIDPLSLKRRLFATALDRVEDPTLHELFREQVIDVDRRLLMLEDRGTPSFLLGSQQVFGKPEFALLATAREILAAIPSRARHPQGAQVLDADAFATLARAELKALRDQCPSLPAKVEIRSDVSGVMVSRGHVLIGTSMKVSSTRAPALVQHEIGTHVVTHFNGAQQPFKLLRTGLSGYEELQEGLAIVAEFLSGGFSRNRLRVLAGRVVAIALMLDGADFVEVFRALLREGFPQRGAFQIAARAFRGGGLTKDIVYLRGLRALTEHVREGDELAELLVGKIGFGHINIVEELRLREVLVGAALRPSYLTDPGALRRLEVLRRAKGPLDLVLPVDEDGPIG